MIGFYSLLDFCKGHAFQKMGKQLAWRCFSFSYIAPEGPNNSHLQSLSVKYLIKGGYNSISHLITHQTDAWPLNEMVIGREKVCF